MQATLLTLVCCLPLLFAHASLAQNTADIRTLDGQLLSAATIDAKVERLMAAHHVAGLGLALIRGGRVAYVHSYGLRDRAAGLPLRSDTVMYGASLTKATFGYMILQLVDEGKLDLDRPIGDYLKKPLSDYSGYSDLKDDPRWRRLTFRLLMNHTSGFNNFRWMDEDKKLRLHRDPGARFGYSGEGVNLAGFVLEQGLALDLAGEMQRRVFDRFGMKRTCMHWRADFAGDFATGYTADGKTIPHDRREYAHAAGSMDTTVDDWSRFLAGAVRGDGLSTRARAEMVRPTILIDSITEFPPLTETRTDRWRAIGLGYAVGWGTFDSSYGHAFFKEGHDDGTDNYALCIEARRDCILMMSNDNHAQAIFATLVDQLLGPVQMPALWEGYAEGDPR